MIAFVSPISKDVLIIIFDTMSTTNHPLNYIYKIYIRLVTALLFFIICFTGIAFGQTCSSDLYIKTYQFPGYDKAGFMDTLPNTDIMWGGTKGYKLYIANSNINGTPLWSKIYSCTSGLYQDNGAMATRDVIGNYFASLDLNYIAMMDASGNPIVAKHLVLPFDIVEVRGISVLPNNQKIVLAKDNSTYSGEGYVIMCFSSDLSAIVWQKHISGSLSSNCYLKISGNDIYVMGMYSGKGLLIKYDQSGNVLIKKEYQVDNKNTILTNIYPYQNGYIVTALYQGGNVNNSILIRLNSNFDITQSFRFVNVQQNSTMALSVEPGGDFHGLWCTGFGISQGLFYMGKYNEVLWHRQSFGNNGKKLLNTPTGLLFFTILTYFDVPSQTPMSAQVLTRTDGNGMIANNSCNMFNTPFQLEALSNTSAISSIDSRDTTIVTLTGATLTATDNIITILNGCSASGTCSSLDIIGNTSSCSFSDTLLYVGRRNQTCYTPVSWSLTGGNAYQQQRNDSTIAISFMQSGTYQLIARLGQTCQAVNDTINIQVTVQGQLPVLNLGPADTLLCPDNTITLNAHSGYASYVWQNASIDSIFMVTQPGTYYVTVTDACGGTQSDTIRVTSYFPGSFSAGQDRIKCNADTLHINSTGGFINYTWKPAYNINSVLNQNVIVYPNIDTTYTVMAEKFPGCFVHDTVKITVRNSPSINLGSDINLCGGADTIADAGPGFTQYLWSTGATTRQVTLYASGTYSVAATYANGCISKDTILIAAFPDPVVTLDKTGTLCTGETRLLDAGNFASFLWNDASTQRTLLVRGIGIYYVTVADANGCRDTDSTEIKTLLPKPGNFLPGDTAICMYSSLKLIAAAGYNSYLWYNNSTGQYLSVNQPGLYWLEVKDNNGCKGRDSINIFPKQCLRGIWVPNAFTPNGDTKNDLFKPSIFGTVKQYELIVFNQFGQTVFRTVNPLEGWNGRVSGRIQNQGTYTWVCTYQVDNQMVNIEHGTVILIH